MKYLKRTKGVALIWALVLCAVLLVISGTMVSYITKESRFSVRIEDSTQAYSYAKNGTEWAKYKIDNGGLANSPANAPYAFDYDNDGTNDNTIVVSGTDGAQIVESTGLYNGASRKIRYDIADTPYVQFDPTAPLASSNSGSFSLLIDFYRGGRSFGTKTAYLGMSNSAQSISDSFNPTYFIGLRVYPQGADKPYESGGIYLMIKSGAAIQQVVINDTTTNTPVRIESASEFRQHLRAIISYTKDTNATVKIEQRNDDGSFACIGTATIDANSLTYPMGNMQSFTNRPTLLENDPNLPVGALGINEAASGQDASIILTKPAIKR